MSEPFPAPVELQWVLESSSDLEDSYVIIEDFQPKLAAKGRKTSTSDNNDDEDDYDYEGINGTTNKREMNSDHSNDHSDSDNDWEIPINQIIIQTGDSFHRCGSQGDVYLGHLNNTPVAVKRVRESSLTNVRHLRELNHKNIIKFYGISGDPKRQYYFILMEWCNNGTLAERLRDGQQPKTLCDFAQQIANGMRYLHSKSIIHRDLKPENILLTCDNEVKISDFGTHEVLRGERSVSTSQTGTYAYMAPEVIRGESQSFPIDVWSYGVVMWEIFIGLQPCTYMDGLSVMWAVGNGLFHLPIPRSLPTDLKTILKLCWRPKPDERITFHQICTRLDGISIKMIKISREQWPSLITGWRNEARHGFMKHLQFKQNPYKEENSEEDHLIFLID